MNLFYNENLFLMRKRQLVLWWENNCSTMTGPYLYMVFSCKAEGRLVAPGIWKLKANEKGEKGAHFPSHTLTFVHFYPSSLICTLLRPLGASHGLCILHRNGDVISFISSILDWSILESIFVASKETGRETTWCCPWPRFQEGILQRWWPLLIMTIRQRRSNY